MVKVYNDNAVTQNLTAENVTTENVTAGNLTVENITNTTINNASNISNNLYGNFTPDAQDTARAAVNAVAATSTEKNYFFCCGQSDPRLSGVKPIFGWSVSDEVVNPATGLPFPPENSREAQFNACNNATDLSEVNTDVIQSVASQCKMIWNVFFARLESIKLLETAKSIQDSIPPNSPIYHLVKNSDGSSRQFYHPDLDSLIYWKTGDDLPEDGTYDDYVTVVTADGENKATFANLSNIPGGVPNRIYYKKIANFYYEKTPDVFTDIENNTVWEYNSEVQIYDGDHASINEGGNLEIKLESINNQYRSSRLVMKDKIDILKLESGKKITVKVEAKLPMAYSTDGSELTATPVWPAIWLMGSGIYTDFENRGWPYCGEIDIMEFALNKEVSLYTNAIHWADNGNKLTTKDNDTGENLTSTFNEYKVEISKPGNNNSPATIAFYFNDTKTISYDLNELQNNLYEEIDNTGSKISDDKYYGLILNVALSGGYTGNAPVPDNFDYAIFEIKNITITKENNTN